MSSSRSVVNYEKDKKIFSRTAKKSKSINNNPPLFRGGIRL